MIAHNESLPAHDCRLDGHVMVTNGYDDLGRPLQHCSVCFSGRYAPMLPVAVCREVGHDWRPIWDGEKCACCGMERDVPHGPVGNWVLVGIIVLGIAAIVGAVWLVVR